MYRVRLNIKSRLWRAKEIRNSEIFAKQSRSSGFKNPEWSKLPMLYFEPMTTIEQLNARGQGYLPGMMGIEFISIEPGRLTSRLAVRPELLAPNGYLHAAAIIALADTTCGYGTFTDLPSGAQNFTTMELKSNFSHAFAYRPRGWHCLRCNTSTWWPNDSSVGCPGDG